MFSKRGLSDVVAVILIIMITVAAIAIIWASVLPVVEKSVSLSCMDVDLSIGTEGFTCYSPNNLTSVQVKKGSNNINITGVKISLISGGNSVSYSAHYGFQPNTDKVFYLNSSSLDSIDKISLVANYSNGKMQTECPSVVMENVQTKMCGQGSIDLGGYNGGSGSTYSGGIIQSEGSCISNCSCALSTAVGQSCSDGCGGSCNGTKPDGSSSYPYVIASWVDLNNMRNNLTANYVLIANLSSSSPGYSGIGNNWEPIGDNVNANSQFNGNNNTISDLIVPSTIICYTGSGYNPVPLTGYATHSPSSPTYCPAGLFSFSSGNISNIGLVNVKIFGNYYTGGLVGYSNYETISNSYVTGNITGAGSSSTAGGLVGFIYGSITNSYSIVNVTCLPTAGGLAGVLYNGATISNSYSSGNVVGAYNIGGLVGASSGTISNSYSNINVTGTGISWGGLVGALTGFNTGGISNSYSIGYVSAGYTGSDTGGLIGLMSYATVNNSYWNNQTSGQLTSVGGIPESSAQMQTPSTYSGWDFTNVWAINPSKNNGYPYLRWQGL